MNYPVDLVYTFVDPTDIKWLTKYQQYNQDVDRIRFDGNTDHMQFSLSTIEKYMNWINKIYIVSDNQRFEIKSKFLNDKIIWIDHSEIIEAKFLPTFNSLVIESFLHLIPNISKYFMYFNDDMFVGSKVDIIDLFDTKTQKPLQFFVDCQYYDHPWMHNIRSANNLFKHIVDFKHKDICPQHAPYFIDKDVMQIVFDQFHSFLQKMFSTDKIRSYNDYSYNLIFIYAMYMSNKKYAVNSRASFSPITKLDEALLNKIKNPFDRKQFYCFYTPIDTTEKKIRYQQIKDIVLYDSL